MKETLISLLTEEFHLPVIQQGSMDPEAAYPESFFTFWNNDTSDGSHYDNDAVAFVWDFDVNFYSSDPSAVNTVMPRVRQLLRANGWIVPGVGYDVTSDEPTHTGRGINALYLQKNTLGGYSNDQ